VGEVLAPGGAVLVELDPRQADAMVAWLREAGLAEIAVHRDAAGRQRVVSARKTP
jgi:methylase of polypeptide subunit release factors